MSSLTVSSSSGWALSPGFLHRAAGKASDELLWHGRKDVFQGQGVWRSLWAHSCLASGDRDSALEALNILYVLVAVGRAKIDRRHTGKQLFFNLSG